LDETKIRQVVMNFLDNALYYTPSGGRVTVELKATDKTIEYLVTDSGIGIPKDEQHNLFTKFYRASNASKMRPDGTGLGLYMVKKVIVAQGGTILFNSVEGEGSTFGFSFSREKLEV
jgi:signal transduction histidine kinase